MDDARHVIGCNVTQETRVNHAFDDVASIIHQSLPPAPLGAPRRWDPPRGPGPPSRGLHSFAFQLNLSSSVHRITQLKS